MSVGKGKVNVNLHPSNNDDDDTVQGVGEGGWPLPKFIETTKTSASSTNTPSRFVFPKVFPP